MSAFIDFFLAMVGVDVAYALVWSLVHSLWQAGLVALGVMVLTSFTKQCQASLRYDLHAGAMLCCVLLSVLTFVVHFQRTVLHLRLSEGTSVSAYIPSLVESSWSAQAHVYVNQRLPQLLLVWCLGLIVLCAKHVQDWRWSQRLVRNNVSALPTHWQVQFEQWQDKLGLSRPVKFLLSMQVDVPCVAAYFKPVVLLPASLLLGMSPQQIEAIVLHELAHIRRHDVALATLQALIRALYFFNPFVLWLSRQVDIEREHACDDMAVRACSQPADYASSLLHFAEMQSHFDSSTRLAIVGKIGNQNMFKHRIQRLFTAKKPVASTVKKSIATTLMLGMVAASASYAWAAHEAGSTVRLSAQNLPLQQLLQQAERGCPGSTEKIKLRHPDALVNANFANVACQDVAALFMDIEERFAVKFTEVEFHAALDVMKQQCPTMFRDLLLKNPKASFSINLQDKSCLQILDVVADFDARVK